MAASGLRQAAAASTAVKPIFSRDLNEAKRRVRELYRAWYREVPNTGERQGCIQGPEAPALLRSPPRAEISGKGSHRPEVPHTGSELLSFPVALVAFVRVFLTEPLGGES